MRSLPSPPSIGSPQLPTNLSSTARATATANDQPSPQPANPRRSLDRALTHQQASPPADPTTLTSGPMCLAQARSLAAGGRQPGRLLRVKVTRDRRERPAHELQP